MAFSRAAERMRLQLGILFCCASIAAASYHAFSWSDKAAAERLFMASESDSLSPQDKYQALRSLEVLGIKREEPATCSRVADILASSNHSLDQIFYAAKIAALLRCALAQDDIKVVAANLVSHITENGSLLDLHFSVGALAVIKEQGWVKEDLALENAIDIFNTIKALGQIDGTWKYSLKESESSAKAAGIALKTLASLISIAGPAIEESMIHPMKGVVSKLFESIESYDDGTQYFDEKKVDMVSSAGSPLAATSYVISGVTAFAAAAPGHLKVPAEKIVGIASFFLSSGVPGNSTDAFYILDALGCLEANSITVPLVLSVPSAVVSLTSKDMFEVFTTTVLGSPVPATVTIVKATKSESKRQAMSTKLVLESDAMNVMHRLDLLGNNIDLGKYDLSFEVKPFDQHKYSAGAVPTTQIAVTGMATVTNVEVGVLDSDTGSPDVLKKWDPSTKEVVSLFATHLQKLHLSLEVFSPLNESFRPHQVFMKLKHESGAEHLFLVKTNGKRMELNLDLLGLVEKLSYLSGVYAMELIVGDVCMENSFRWALGMVELDLPEPSEDIAKGTAADVPSYLPKKEIVHVFQPKEKRAPSTLSNGFFVLTLMPLLGFLIGLKLLNTNLKSFPMSGLPMIAALAFHGGIASILGLYVLFWLKFNLFETLKILGILSLLLVLPGQYHLSHLADSSSKVKAA